MCSPPARGPLLAAHSLRDGTFTWADPVAKRYAKRVCKQRPDLSAMESLIDEGDVMTALVCGMVWELDQDVLTTYARGVQDEVCADIYKAAEEGMGPGTCALDGIEERVVAARASFIAKRAARH